jgi:hypothetical protein
MLIVLSWWLTVTRDCAGEAVVQWTTRRSRGGRVVWGYRSGKYTHSAAASDLSYRREDMCGAPASEVRCSHQFAIGAAPAATHARYQLISLLGLRGTWARCLVAHASDGSVAWQT